MSPDTGGEPLMASLVKVHMIVDESEREIERGGERREKEREKRKIKIEMESCRREGREREKNGVIGR